MPLSEEELRQLEQMERALAEEDPKFASTLRGTAFRRSARRRAIVAGVVFAAGVVLLMTGAVLRMPFVGIAGFVIMLASAMVAVTSMRGRSHAQAESRPSGHEGFEVIDGGKRGRGRGHRLFGRGDRGGGHGGQSGTFMERIEHRWHRRREQGF